MIDFFLCIADEIEAHAQKVRCLDLGETGRVLVTGGQDRNVNLWAFGNDKCFMVNFCFLNFDELIDKSENDGRTDLRDVRTEEFFFIL